MQPGLPNTSSPEQSQDEGKSSPTMPTAARMKVVTVLRLPEHEFYGTFGVFIDSDEGVPICVTVERTWKNNGLNSCISEGEYICKRTEYIKGSYETFEVTGVKGRSRILIHKGNLDSQSAGCIILGEKYDPVFNRKTGEMDYGILSSGEAFREFMELMEGQEKFKLIITRWREK